MRPAGKTADGYSEPNQWDKDHIPMKFGDACRALAVKGRAHTLYNLGSLFLFHLRDLPGAFAS